MLLYTLISVTEIVNYQVTGQPQLDGYKPKVSRNEKECSNIWRDYASPGNSGLSAIQSGVRI